jgi:lysophospholipase L1-like esterase
MATTRLRALLTAATTAALAAALLTGSATGSQTTTHGAARVAAHGRTGAWAGTWGTAVQHPMPGNEFFGPNWSMEGFADQSVRQVVRVSTGGARVRIRLSNLYGTGPLRVAGATIGKAGEGAAVRPGTIRELRFGGSPSTTIPAGGGVSSDAARLRVAPLDKLTVTLFFAEPSGPATFHEGGFTTTYRATGDHRVDPGAAAFGGETSHSFYVLAGVDVAGGAGASRGTVAAFGDSITDGAFSTPGADDRYPDELAERLVGAGRPMGVVNLGINGNKLLSDSTCFGEKGVTRFPRQVLSQPGIRTAIVLEGINDIGSAGQPDFGCGVSPAITVEQLIEGHRTLIRAAHARGVRILGATLTPFKGNEFYFNERTEAMRDALNHWIRTSGEYDAVVDFDRALADPADPDAMRPAYDAGDHLHPNDAGMAAMAAVIDLRTL